MKIRAILSVFLTLVLVAGYFGAFIACASAIPVMVKDGNPCIAPFSSAYYTWLNTRSGTSCEDQEGHGLGLIPAPVDLSGATESAAWTNNANRPQVVSYTIQKNAGSLEPTTYAVAATAGSNSYDLRTIGKLTPIKNQGQDGNCWAFASIGSLESSLLPGESYDFSENNEKNLHGFTVPINLGGNDFMATAYLVRWSGPVSETADPYTYGNSISPSGIPIEKHIQEVFFIPTRRQPLDNDLIKSAVKEYGAVYSTLRYESTSYTQRTAAYYYSGSGGFNHAIDIVGWDDEYATTNFNTPPPGNGAFIARNSWGSTWGDSGYFYISYYDTRIGRDNAMFTAQPKNTYTQIYQYDPLGWVANFGFGTDTAYYANVFNAVGSEQLKAVGFYTTATNTEYEVKIFLNPDNGPISSAGYSSEQNGTISLPGYHTIPLDNPVNLKKGDRFSVAVKVVSTGWTTPVAIELPISGYSSEATALAGQSYISSNGAGWSDLTLSEPNTNVCLKAYTVSGSTSSTEIKPTLTGRKITSLFTSSLSRNISRSSVPVKVNTQLKYLDTGVVNKTYLTDRSIFGQVTKRNTTQSLESVQKFNILKYPSNTGNVSSTINSAGILITKY
jgi:C1A family cysteine protease